MLTVDEDEDDAVEFSSSNCCTCRMSTYSSSWFCEFDAADDEAAAAEISAEFGRLPFKSDRGENYVGDFCSESNYNDEIERKYLRKSPPVIFSLSLAPYLTWLISTIIWCSSIAMNWMVIQMR